MPDDKDAGGSAPDPAPSPPTDDHGDGLAAAFEDIDKDLVDNVAPSPPREQTSD